MNAKEFAESLSGRTAGKEITETECDLAHRSNWLVLFGHSDDCVECRGFLTDEFPEQEIMIFHSNKLNKLISSDECEYNPKLVIVGYYSLDGIWSILISGKVDYYSFDIYQNEELYCIGVVVDLLTLKD